MSTQRLMGLKLFFSRKLGVLRKVQVLVLVLKVTAPPTPSPKITKKSQVWYKKTGTLRIQPRRDSWLYFITFDAFNRIYNLW